MIKTYSREFNPTQGEKLWSQVKKQNTIYQEYTPCRELQEYVACYWISKTIYLEDKPIVNRIIPDGCMDIVFNINKIAQGKGAGVSGIMTTPEIREVNGIIEYVGIRFLPGGIIPFINESATSFTNQLIALEDIWGREGIAISEKIYTATSVEERMAIIETMLKCKLSNINGMPDFLKSVLHLIYLNKGVISIKELALGTYTSQRHLSRRFKEHIGTSPKTFSNIIRFQQIINQMNDNINIDFTSLVQSNGYYDQSHFIKEFKTFYGKAPTQL